MEEAAALVVPDADRPHRRGVHLRRNRRPGRRADRGPLAALQAQRGSDPLGGGATIDLVAPPLLVAHRLPDSSAQCAALAAAGAGGFELDVQLRGDTVVVSHYLPFLQIPGWLEHDGTRFRWGGRQLRDPELAQAMDRVPDEALVVLDPKEMRPGRRRRLAAALVAALDQMPAQRSRCVVSTHDPAELGTYRAAGIATWRTLGAARDVAAVLGGEPLADAGVAVRHTLLARDVVRRLRNATSTIAAWTVNDVGRARELAELGVDVITTDQAEVLSALRAG